MHCVNSHVEATEASAQRVFKKAERQKQKTPLTCFSSFATQESAL